VVVIQPAGIAVLPREASDGGHRALLVTGGTVGAIHLSNWLLEIAALPSGCAQ
jgi:hypothetical protein